MQQQRPTRVAVGKKGEATTPSGKIPGQERQARLVATEVNVSALEQEGSRGEFERAEGDHNDARFKSEGLDDVVPKKVAKLLPHDSIPFSGSTAWVGALVRLDRNSRQCMFQLRHKGTQIVGQFILTIKAFDEGRM